jgi:DUF177 domain-containing protein
MLQVDLARLRHERRVTLAAEVPATSALWAQADVHLAGPLHVHVEAQQAGSDVVVRGELQGEVAAVCRRCLKPLRVPVARQVSALYAPEAELTDPSADEVFPLPSGRAALDVSELVRQELILAVPEFPVCDEACRGLCPRCGRDLNEGPCGCEARDSDPRWAPLRAMLKAE